MMHWAGQNEYDTEHVRHNGKRFCVYCGKEIEVTNTWDEYFKNSFYHCNCEEANIEHIKKERITELGKELEDCKRQLPKPKFGITSIFGKL